MQTVRHAQDRLTRSLRTAVTRMIELHCARSALRPSPWAVGRIGG